MFKLQFCKKIASHGFTNEIVIYIISRYRFCEPYANIYIHTYTREDVPHREGGCELTHTPFHTLAYMVGASDISSLSGDWHYQKLLITYSHSFIMTHSHPHHT